jgi:hypothetical protein
MSTRAVRESRQIAAITPPTTHPPGRSGNCIDLELVVDSASKGSLRLRDKCTS